MSNELERDLLKVLVTEEELKTRVAELGEALCRRFSTLPSARAPPNIYSRPQSTPRSTVFQFTMRRLDLPGIRNRIMAQAANA